MTQYLNKTFNWQSEEIVAVYDDMPTWSAMPGNALLEAIEYAPNKTVVDIGFGTGYPLLQLAERFGSTCKLYGIDIWEEAIKHAKLKAKRRNINNITFIEANAKATTLKENSVDIITSNLGINNFDNPEAVIQECARVLKSKGEIYLSSNLVGTFKEFYKVFQETLRQLNLTAELEKLKEHINHRATVAGVKYQFIKHGFSSQKVIEQSYTINYANGSAFLNDYFIVMSFLPSWKAIVPTVKQEQVFSLLEDNLNSLAQQKRGLKLRVPYAVFRFTKQ
jgi:ubiquinone/menaquinone biosynthesis C-methylase UbiE